MPRHQYYHIVPVCAQTRRWGRRAKIVTFILVSLYKYFSPPPFSDEASEGLSRHSLSLAGSPPAQTSSPHPLTSLAAASSLIAIKWPHTPSERLYKSLWTTFINNSHLPNTKKTQTTRYRSTALSFDEIGACSLQKKIYDRARSKNPF